MLISNTNGHSTTVQNTLQSTLRETPPNAGTLTKSLRKMGYNPYRAMMDLVDNAIDAHANNIRILVDHQDVHANASKASTRKKKQLNAKFNENSKIFIIDDGVGMDEFTLDQAVRFGSEIKHNTRTDLGKYGMGLKTASLSFGTKLCVWTRREGQPLLRAILDVNEIVKLNRFVTNFAPPTPDEIAYFNNKLDSQTKSGTILCISDLDQLGMKDVRSFRDTLRGKTNLARIYRYFLNSGKRITVDKTEVEAWDPTFWEDSKTRQLTKGWQEIKLDKNGSSAKMKLLYRACIYKGAHGPKQGIIWVRNLREIEARHDEDIWKFNVELAGFCVEIRFIGEHLDDLFGIPIPKDRVSLDQRVKDILQEHVGSISKQAIKDSFAAREAKQAAESDVTEFLDSYVDDVKAAEKFLDIPVGSEDNGNNEEEGSTSKAAKPVVNPRGPYGPRDDITGRRSVGWNYRFELHSMGEYAPVCTYEQNDFEGWFACYANRDHPFVASQIATGDESCKAPAANILLAMSLAESQLNDHFLDAFEEFKEKFAKNLKGLTNHVH